MISSQCNRVKSHLDTEAMVAYYSLIPEVKTAMLVSDIAIAYRFNQLDKAMSGQLDTSQPPVSERERRLYEMNDVAKRSMEDLNAWRQDKPRRDAEEAARIREHEEIKESTRKIQEEVANMPPVRPAFFEPKISPQAAKETEELKKTRERKFSKVNPTTTVKKESGWKKAAPFLIVAGIVCMIAIPIILVFCLI